MQPGPHIERAESHAAEDTHCLGRAMEPQTKIWYQQCRLEDAMSEATLALETCEKLGLAKGVEDRRDLLREIGGARSNVYLKWAEP